MTEIDAPSDGEYRELGLRAWPFRLVPLSSPTTEWFDQTSLRDNINRLLFRYRTQSTSTLHLIWADVGSGKTHTLRFIEGACLQAHLRPVYAVLPRTIRSFVQVYGAITDALDLRSLVTSLRSKGLDDDALRRLVPDWPDLATCLALVERGSALDAEIARAWLAGSRDITRVQATRLGLTRSIRTTDDAVLALVALTRLILETSHRFVVLIDEMQRVGQVRSAVSADISAGIHTWYNAVPDRLSIVLAYSFGERSYLPAYVTQELLSRQDHQTVDIPLLSTDDCVMLVNGLLEEYLIKGHRPPISDQLVRAIVAELPASVARTPRNVIKAFDAVLTEIQFRKFDKSGPPSTRVCIDLIKTITFDEDVA